jgi:hypothetical protein
VMGTPQYLSPEQALGKTVDHRSDLYATGCLLFELLALRPPFTGETPLSVVYQHVQDQPQPPSLVNNRVPPELDGLVLRALAKQPEDRFQSAEEMRGVVGYALQALSDQGGWTGGRWNTGAVTAIAPAPTRMSSTVVAQAGPGSGHTAEMGLPLLAGVAGTGGPDEVHGYGAPPPGGGGGNRWLKPVLFGIVAVMAIALGVYFATKDHGTANTPADTTSPSVSQPADQPSDQPSDTPSTSGEISTGPTDTSTGTPSSTPSTTPATTATTAPTTTPPTTKTPTSKPTTPPPATTTPPPVTITPPTDPPTTPPDASGGNSGGPGGKP